MSHDRTKAHDPTPPFTPPRGGPGRRDGGPPGSLPRPHFERQGDEQRQPTPDELVELAKVQREIGQSPE